MNKSDRDKRIERAQTRILFNTPFFAPGVARLPVVWDESVKTACTDGVKILAAPSFVDSLTDGQLGTLLCHEAAHCLLGHLWREDGREPEPWNHATDYAVNGLLDEFAALRTAKGLASPFPMPEGALLEKRYVGMAEEAIYGLLTAPKPPGNKPPGNGPSGGSGASSPGKKAAPGQPCAQRQPFGEFIPANKGAKKQEEDWQATLIQSAAAYKARGDLPGSIARLVGEIVAPKVPWQDILRSFLREHAADDYDFTTHNPLWDETGFILPSLRSEKCGAVVFATDWSGSIDRTLAGAFHGEKQACLDDIQPTSLLDLAFDTAVTLDRLYRPGDEIDKRGGNGGGTDFRCVFERVAKMEEPPRCLVILTDLDGTMPDAAPHYPVLWVSYGSDKAPFGQVVLCR